MFCHEGWKILEAEFELNIDALKEGLLDYAQDYDRVMYTRGRIATLRDIKNFPVLVEASLEEDDEDEQTDSV